MSNRNLEGYSKSAFMKNLKETMSNISKLTIEMSWRPLGKKIIENFKSWKIRQNLQNKRPWTLIIEDD